MKIYKKAILPNSFQASAVASGIKKSGKLDLALIYSRPAAIASCKFTKNSIVAAPIKLAKLYLKKNKTFYAIIINSGNANCFTGKKGFEDAREITGFAAKSLCINKEDVLSASTGIIGKRLPLSAIKQNIPQLVRGLSGQGIDKLAQAILTTDTSSKEITLNLDIGGQIITICGVAKGAGMIAPDMATMLAFILTDARISQRALDRALGICVNDSFNCITVDGCMSTNDSVMMLANAAAGNPLIEKGKNLDLFTRALRLVCVELARMIVRDAEGASKFITITLRGAKDFNEARTIALAIANSNLFKTAIYGENSNFGRIVAAVGASGIDIEEKYLKVKVSPLNRKEINVEVSLKRGKSCATVYTSDLTPKYIKINAQYN